MQITYEKRYKKVQEGRNWIMYSDVNDKDSLIVKALEELITKETNLFYTFDQVFEALGKRYNNRKERSRCNISMVGGKRIEVSTRGTFPRFYIEKIK